MPNRRTRDVTSREAVLAAIAECDERGREAFLDEYGFGEATQYHLVHGSVRYDRKAILDVAYAKQYPEEPPLRAREFNGGVETTAVLERLGFRIEERPSRDRSDSSASVSVRAALEEVLPTYDEARRSEPFGRQSAAWQSFEALAAGFQATSAVASRPTVKVHGPPGSATGRECLGLRFSTRGRRRRHSAGSIPCCCFVRTCRVRT